MGQSQIIALIRSKFMQLEESLSDKLHQMLWATSVGNGGKDFLSIPVIVSDTGILGGIDPSTETWWKSKTVATVNLTTVAGVKVLNNVYNSLVDNLSKIDLEFTDQGNFEAYEALAVPSIRFNNTKMADLGFESIAHKGADLVFDSRCPTGKWYFLNSDHIEFVKHSARWMKRREGQKPPNQDATSFLTLSAGQLATDQRRAHGVISASTV